MLKKYLPVDIGATGVPVPGTGVVRVCSAAGGGAAGGVAGGAAGCSAGGGAGCLPTGGLDELAVEDLAVGVYVDDGCLAVVVAELALSCCSVCVQNRTINIDRACEKINFWLF